jgi:hypothetical protein
MKKTPYQKTHHPIKRVEVKCNGHRGANDLCVVCGRWIRRNGSHNPSITGSLGWIETYKDGTTYVDAPAKLS